MEAGRHFYFLSVFFVFLGVLVLACGLWALSGSCILLSNPWLFLESTLLWPLASVGSVFQAPVSLGWGLYHISLLSQLLPYEPLLGLVSEFSTSIHCDLLLDCGYNVTN